MEVKKSPKADLEKTKGMGVLMGMVVGLAVLFVGFEWGTRDIQVVTADEGVADIIAEEETPVRNNDFAPLYDTVNKIMINMFKGQDRIYVVHPVALFY